MTGPNVRAFLCAALLAASLGATPHTRTPADSAARIVASSLPYLPGSAIPLQIEGSDAPFALHVLGQGTIAGGTLHVAQPFAESTTVIAAANGTLAMHRFTAAQPPDPRVPFLAVASYDSGIVIHDTAAPFTARSVLGIGGAPADVALDGNGRLAAGDTAGTALTLAALDPWHVASVADVPFTDEVAFDPASHALFATNRDVNGSGALTRVAQDGSVTRTILGLTSEGLALDARRERVYVANANDGTISIVDARTMKETRRFNAVARAFSLALSPDASRMYVVSNQSVSSPFAAAGGVVAIDLTKTHPRVIAHSSRLAFPIGVALDAAHRRLFVTDEHDDTIDVLNAVTLRPAHAPLHTCRTPWKPTLDAQSGRLYVPCAQADAVDVFDAQSLRRVPGAPFATGGYPLAVAVWHPRPNVVR